MKLKPKKLGLKLNLGMDDLEDNSVSNTNANITNVNTNNTTKINNKFSSVNSLNNISETDLNRGIKIMDRINFEKSTEIELIHYYLKNPCYLFDFSYHWIEKNNNIKRIAEPIEIDLYSEFKEPLRDPYCEYELIKLICDSNTHKNNLIEIPKSLKKLNRYSDILPCKIYTYNNKNYIIR